MVFVIVDLFLIFGFVILFFLLLVVCDEFDVEFIINERLFFIFFG